MFYIHQITDTDCGITALKVLMANIFNSEDYLFIKEDENHGAYSLQELIDIAKTYGLELSGVCIDNFDLEQFPKKPFLAVIKPSEETTHLIYVHKVRKNSLTIFDPINGVKTLSKDKFLELFDGSALIIESKKETHQVEKREVDLKTSYKVFSTIIQILSYASLICGTFFISDDSYVFIPIICFSLYIILQILLEKYLTICMKKVDAFYLERIASHPHDTKVLLTRLSEYKKSLFIGPIKLTGDVITVIFISAIMIMNEKNTLIILGSIVLILLLNYLFLDDYMKKKDEELALMERTLPNHVGEGEYLEMVLELNSRVYNQVMAKRSIRYVAIFLLILATIITMILSKIVSVPFVLLHLVFALTIFDKSKEILYFDKDLDKKRVDYMKLINLAR